MSQMLGLLGTRYHIFVEIQPFDIQSHGKGMMKWEKSTVNPLLPGVIQSEPTIWILIQLLEVIQRFPCFNARGTKACAYYPHVHHACQILQQCNIHNKRTTLEILPRHFWITPYQTRLHIRHLQLMMYCQEWWSRKYLLQCRIDRSWKKVPVPVSTTQCFSHFEVSYPSKRKPTKTLHQ